MSSLVEVLWWKFSGGNSRLERRKMLLLKRSSFLSKPDSWGTPQVLWLKGNTLDVQKFGRVLALGFCLGVQRGKFAEKMWLLSVTAGKKIS